MLIDKVTEIAETLIRVQENADNASAVRWDIVGHRHKELIIAVAVQCASGEFQVWVIADLATETVEAT